MASRKRIVSRKPKKSRERAHRSAAQWLARLKGGEGKVALHLPPDFVLWVFAGLLAHLDRRGDAHVAELAEGALVHGGRGVRARRHALAERRPPARRGPSRDRPGRRG